MKARKWKAQHWIGSEKTCQARLGQKWRVIEPWVTQEIQEEANGAGITRLGIGIQVRKFSSTKCNSHRCIPEAVARAFDYCKSPPYGCMVAKLGTVGGKIL